MQWRPPDRALAQPVVTQPVLVEFEAVGQQFGDRLMQARDEKSANPRLGHILPGDFVPRTPLHRRSRGPPGPAPRRWLARSARSRWPPRQCVPRTPLHRRSRGPPGPAPRRWLARSARSRWPPRQCVPRTPLHRRSRGPPGPAPRRWLARSARSRWPPRQCVPRTPLHRRSRGPPGPAPRRWLARSARSRWPPRQCVPRTPLHRRSRGPPGPAPRRWLTRSARSRWPPRKALPPRQCVPGGGPDTGARGGPRAPLAAGGSLAALARVALRASAAPGPPYTGARGGPSPHSAPVARFAALARVGLRASASPDPLTPALAGAPGPRSAPVARSLRSLALASAPVRPSAFARTLTGAGAGETSPKPLRGGGGPDPHTVARAPSSSGIVNHHARRRRFDCGGHPCRRSRTAHERRRTRPVCASAPSASSNASCACCGRLPIRCSSCRTGAKTSPGWEWRWFPT